LAPEFKLILKMSIIYLFYIKPSFKHVFKYKFIKILYKIIKTSCKKEIEKAREELSVRKLFIFETV